mgnify:CR=1 FL=1
MGDEIEVPGTLKIGGTDEPVETTDTPTEDQ